MKFLLLLIGCSTVILLGCGPRLSVHREMALEIGEIVVIPIEPTDREQTIKVLAGSLGVPLNVHIYLKEHEDAIVRMITLGKPPEDLLAYQLEAKQISLTAVVPANKVVIVRLQAAETLPTTVQVEITN